MIVRLAAILLLCWATPISAQDTLELMRRYGGLDEHILHNVRTAALRAQDVVVLTDPGPAIHRFAGDDYVTFGREGTGPAELSSPADVAWTSTSLIVLDVNLHKLVSFGEDGEFLASRTFAGEWANRVYVVDGDTILGAFAPMTGQNAVVRLRGERRDTLLTYRTDRRQVRLEAPGAPGLTLSHPFTPRLAWTVLADGVLAAWDPDDGWISRYLAATART
jgi:hypothetical protein